MMDGRQSECAICHSVQVQHAIADDRGVLMRLCFPCFDRLRAMMAQYFLDHGWQAPSKEASK